MNSRRSSCLTRPSARCKPVEFSTWLCTGFNSRLAQSLSKIFAWLSVIISRFWRQFLFQLVFVSYPCDLLIKLLFVLISFLIVLRRTSWWRALTSHSHSVCLVPPTSGRQSTNCLRSQPLKVCFFCFRIYIFLVKSLFNTACTTFLVSQLT